MIYSLINQVCKTSQENENQDNSENRCSSNSDLTENNEERSQQIDLESIGIATGNWGCGAFGGDPEMKSMIQWLAASQVPFTCFCSRRLHIILVVLALL